MPKNSTSRTILAATNTLVGSGCLLLPLVMKDSGIITTILSLTFIGKLKIFKQIYKKRNNVSKNL